MPPELGGIEMQLLTVTAAVIERDGKFLVAQRPGGTHQGLKWEFPGGKVEPGEDPRRGLEREIREELAFDVEAGDVVDVVSHVYPGRHVILIFYRCRVVRGEPKAVGCAALRWAPPEELLGLDLAPADVPVAQRLAAERRSYPDVSFGQYRIVQFCMSMYDQAVALWKAAGLSIKSSDSYEEIARKLERDPELFLAAVDQDGRLVGTVIGAFDGRRAWVYHLAVEPALQGRGIGTALMQELERRLQNIGVIKVNLHVENWNSSVKGFYRRLGYEEAPVTMMGKYLR